MIGEIIYMIYRRWGEWSYNAHNNDGSNRICYITNNEGKRVKLNSITLYLGIAADNTWANHGESVTGNGGSVKICLSTSSDSKQNSSSSVTISSPKKGTYESGGDNSGLYSYITSGLTARTFTFNNLILDNNETLYFYYYRESGSNVIICPRDTYNGEYVGDLYTDQNFARRAVRGSVSDPYTAPSYSISDISPDYGIVKETARTVKYSITGGTNSLKYTYLRTYNSNNTYLEDINLNTTSKGSNLSKTFNPNSSKYSDGQQYKGAIRFDDGQNTFETGKSSFYTYRTPKISGFNLTNINFSGNGNTQLSWSTNGRRWSTSNEANFKTYIRFGSKSWFESSNNNPNTGDTNNALVNQAQNLSKDIIDKQFTTTERSQEKISTTIQMKRKNETSKVETLSSSKSITIQMFPKYAPSRMTFYNYSSGSKGSTISPGSTVYVDDISKILIEWTYPDNVDKGIINGYIVRIYSDSDYSNLLQTFTINNSNLTASQAINTKTHLKRGQLNYVKITAFYNKPNGTGKAEGLELKSSFVLPLGRLSTPVIDYPINNTSWHNNKFRILFKLPSDTDYDTYSSSIQNSYQYRNIEVKINNKVYSFKSGTSNMSSGAIVNANIFSTSSMSYKKAIVINPSLIFGFENTTKYSISIRVQKNYYEPIWSNWSSTVILNNVAIQRINIKQYDIIMNTHYNTMRNYSKRLYDVYPISSLNSNNKSIVRGDIIKYNNYTAIYQTIKNIQNDVNSYAQFDSNRQNVKFNQTINTFDNPNQPTQEFITALDNAKPNIQGRNYINLLIECMLKLY